MNIDDLFLTLLAIISISGVLLVAAALGKLVEYFLLYRRDIIEKWREKQ